MARLVLLELLLVLGLLGMHKGGGQWAEVGGLDRVPSGQHGPCRGVLLRLVLLMGMVLLRMPSASSAPKFTSSSSQRTQLVGIDLEENEELWDCQLLSKKG